MLRYIFHCMGPLKIYTNNIKQQFISNEMFGHAEMTAVPYSTSQLYPKCIGLKNWSERMCLHCICSLKANVMLPEV